MRPAACLLLVLLAMPLAAAKPSARIVGGVADAEWAWLDEDGRVNPTIYLPPGQTVEIEVVSTSGIHKLAVLGQASADVDGDPATDTPASTTFAFTTPAGGNATYTCPYHPAMKATMVFGAASPGEPPARTPGAPVGLLLAALALVALAQRK